MNSTKNDAYSYHSPLYISNDLYNRSNMYRLV